MTYIKLPEDLAETDDWYGILKSKFSFIDIGYKIDLLCQNEEDFTQLILFLL